MRWTTLSERFKQRRNRELVAHYLTHGQSGCEKCARGFDIYWTANRDK